MRPGSEATSSIADTKRGERFIEDHLRSVDQIDDQAGDGQERESEECENQPEYDTVQQATRRLPVLHRQVEDEQGNTLSAFNGIICLDPYPGFADIETAA